MLFFLFIQYIFWLKIKKNIIVVKKLIKIYFISFELLILYYLSTEFFNITELYLIQIRTIIQIMVFFKN